MDYKNKDVIINRFNDSIKYIAEMQKAIFNDNRSSEIEGKRNAGEALSSAFEWSVKHHLFHYAKNIPQNWKDSDFRDISWPDLLKNLRDKKKAVPFTLSLPNFYTLYDDKRDGRNISTHSGKEPIEENIYSFAEQIRKVIIAYVDKNAILHNVDDYLDFNATGWENLYLTCNKFSRTDTNYILIVGNLKNQPAPYKRYLGSLPWNLIIDFDQSSREENGFFHDSYKDNVVQPQIIKITDKDLGTEFFPIEPKSHFHYFVKGYVGDGANLDYAMKWGIWNERNRANLSGNFQKTISAFASKYSNPTKVVIFHDDKSFVIGLCGILNSIFAQRIEFILSISNPRLFEDMEDFGYSVKQIPISLSELSIGISLHYKDFEIQNFFENTFRLPHHKNTKSPNVDGMFTIDEMASMEEDMEVLHLDIGNNPDTEDRMDFLRGKMPLSWFGAKLKDSFDVRHPNLKSIIRDIEEKGKRGIYYIKHEPGVGGTTLSRRIAWDLHFENPTVILKEYRDGDRIISKLKRIHEKTRERIYIIANVPQAISTDHLKELELRLKANEWPYLVVAIGRDLPKANSTLTNWGNNCIELINEFGKYLPDLGYSDETVKKKRDELRAIFDGNDGDKKSPFYIGFLISEEKFFAVDPYIQSFVDSLKTAEQRKIIQYLALIQNYLGISLPAIFFSKLLKTAENKKIEKLLDFLPRNFDHVLSQSVTGNSTYWSTRHPLFARKFKEKLLRGSSSQEFAWKENLPDLCQDFIEDSNISGEQSSYIQEDILQPLFIGSRKQRGGNAFTPLVEELSIESQEAVFLKLAEVYPDNAHYSSHLARFYAYKMKNSEKALWFADKAISLSELGGYKDALLYHIRGMCYRQAAKIKMDSVISAKRYGRPYFPEDVDEIIHNLIPTAAQEFEETRKLQRNSEYGYVAHIQMLIEAIDFGHILSDQTKAEFLSSEKEPYAEWLDQAATLLEEVKRLTLGEEGFESEKVNQCDEDLNAFYEKFELVIQNLNNQLIKGNHPERIRRQITRFMIKRQPDYSRDPGTIRRIMDLMSENIKNEPDKEGNFYLWFQAARYSNITIADAIDKMARWKAKSITLDAAYYFYVLKVIRAIEGYSEEMADAFKLLQESRQKARALPHNTYCHEWYGVNREMKRLVSGKEVYGGDWSEKCELVRGTITEFNHNGDGNIILKNANLLKVFFNPSETKITEDYLNREVEFYLGFSYDGLRAKNVQPIGRILQHLPQVRNTNSLESVAKVIIENIPAQEIVDEPKIIVLPEKNLVIKKQQIKVNSNLTHKTFQGEIKIKRLNDGFIKCPSLDKDVAFNRIQLSGFDMPDIEVGENVEVEILLTNGKLATNSLGNNYKASKVKRLN